MISQCSTADLTLLSERPANPMEYPNFGTQIPGDQNTKTPKKFGVGDYVGDDSQHAKIQKKIASLGAFRIMREISPLRGF